jgi:hypothetical protein
MASEAKAAEPERHVLADLDSRIPTTFYWYLAVLACIGGFLFGYDTSNIGSALGFIPYHLSSFAVGYLVAGASLGRGGGSTGGRAADGPFRAEDSARHRRRHLRHRRDLIRGHGGRGHAAGVPGR